MTGAGRHCTVASCVCCVDWFCRFQITTEGERHTLLVSRVSDNMNLGVHIVAKNDAGEDSCMIDVRTIGEDDSNNNADDNSGRPNRKKLLIFTSDKEVVFVSIYSFC